MSCTLKKKTDYALTCTKPSPERSGSLTPSNSRVCGTYKSPPTIDSSITNKFKGYDRTPAHKLYQTTTGHNRIVQV